MTNLIDNSAKDVFSNTNLMIFDRTEKLRVDGTIAYQSWSNRVYTGKHKSKINRTAAQSAEIHFIADNEYTVYIENEEIGTYETPEYAARVIECKVVQYCSF